MFLLDTNVISELRRPDRTDPAVRHWASSWSIANFYLSTITILEVHLGALRLERRDKVQGVAIRSWVEQLLGQFDGRILPLDSGVALRTAELHVPDPKSDRDAIIAATGLVHGMTVVTRNVRDFQGTGVKLLDPWTSATLGG